MKRILSRMFIVITLAVTLGSCKKEDFLSGSSQSPDGASSTSNIYLVAKDWISYPDKLYVSTFKDIIPRANVVRDRIVTVYVEEQSTQVQISNRHIQYNGNELWALNSATDVSIIYRCDTGVPFKSLNIRVEVK